MGVFSLGKVVLGSLFKKPSTLMYPVVPREWEERTRGAVSINVDGCVLCGACARACPTHAIEVDRKGSTWAIERMACIQCRGCVDNCPPKCLDMDQKRADIVRSFGFHNKFSQACGSAQKLDGDLYVIGWGWATTDAECMSVYDFSGGKELMSISLGDPKNITYRCAYYE